ncbi:MAG: HU family DNA-binding protein [Bacteroidales bacterium]|nr:HU family DNA-binding protein [Bacteroidales bacterium]MDD4216915.1 HU family DNA-binding protein [Bacteroidales bacterium]MDY0141216.1 HU family DNA-binding protein [Bacteroidales bacterium]
MNRPQLIDIIAKKGNISKVAASESLKLVLGSIGEALATGENVTLVGFGTFRIAELAARTGRNPQTGKALQIPAKKVVRFKARNELASKVKVK